MRILSADITSFGGVSDLILKDLDAPVVCVSGPNEIGKSTFYRFLVVMLFGLPARKAARRQLMPNDGRALQGRLRYRHADKLEHLLERRLDSKPES
ncbi:MAG: AAA family ATPase, partial [Rhodothermales bacterium]|nr:AAA family ATPase [Rhodothermales bacterium]